MVDRGPAGGAGGGPARGALPCLDWRVVDVDLARIASGGDPPDTTIRRQTPSERVSGARPSPGYLVYGACLRPRAPAAGNIESASTTTWNTSLGLGSPARRPQRQRLCSWAFS